MAHEFVPSRQPEPLLGARILGLRLTTEVQLVERLEAGLSPTSVDRLARRLDMPVSRLLARLDIKSSTYHDRKARSRPLGAEASGRVYRLAKVVEAAENYFDDRESATRWLLSAKTALGGRVPIEFARTAEGAEYVVKLLGRLAHGVIT